MVSDDVDVFYLCIGRRRDHRGIDSLEILATPETRKTIGVYRRDPDQRTARKPGAPARSEGSCRSCESGQEFVSRQYESRAAHSIKQYPRVYPAFVTWHWAKR